MVISSVEIYKRHWLMKNQTGLVEYLRDLWPSMIWGVKINENLDQHLILVLKEFRENEKERWSQYLHDFRNVYLRFIGAW